MQWMANTAGSCVHEKPSMDYAELGEIVNEQLFKFCLYVTQVYEITVKE